MGYLDRCSQCEEVFPSGECRRDPITAEFTCAGCAEEQADNLIYENENE